jgi:Chalcone isomerase N-terminal domain
MSQQGAGEPRIPEWRPMRSAIIVSVRDDSDLPVAYRWLYKHHIADAISQFAPYVTKYCTYRALPLPSGAEDFGSYNFIMTEHYWLINPFETMGTATPRGLAFTEFFTQSYMEATRQPVGHGLRPSHWMGTREGYHPTVFAFLPMFWEDDFKGTRTVEDGPNFRWLTSFAYPQGVSCAEGDEWYKTQFAPAVCALPQVTRFFSSRVLDHPRVSPFHRFSEIWFENSREWEAAMVDLKDSVPKPPWATYEMFPYFEPYKDFVGVFLLDRPESDHLQQYRGYVTTR